MIKIPNSRLGKLSKAATHQEILNLCSDYSLVDNEYFFDRLSILQISQSRCFPSVFLDEGAFP